MENKATTKERQLVEIAKKYGHTCEHTEVFDTEEWAGGAYAERQQVCERGDGHGYGRGPEGGSHPVIYGIVDVGLSPARDQYKHVIHTDS